MDGTSPAAIETTCERIIYSVTDGYLLSQDELSGIINQLRALAAENDALKARVAELTAVVEYVDEIGRNLG